MKTDNNISEIDNIINSAFDNFLRSKFEERLQELGISKNQALDNMEITSRTLDGLLDGSLKQVDFVCILKLAQFLEMPYDKMFSIYKDLISRIHKDDLESYRKRSFIINNFDLPVLKSVGVINTIKDFDHIENRIKEIFDLESIYDFDFQDGGIAFSTVTSLPKSLNNRRYFIANAKAIFKKINNPFPYNEDLLKQYFSKIRWQSLDTENGLLKVIQTLYKMGVSVIFRPKIPKTKMRGATFLINVKPCIVLTDYKGYYPTLWFALLHELFHVIFDWKELIKNPVHISDSESILIDQKRENEADQFAVDYFINKNDKEKVFSKIQERLFIREYAIDTQIHTSIIYAIYAYENKSWAEVDQYFPQIKPILKNLGSSFTHEATVSQVASFYKSQIFNNE